MTTVCELSEEAKQALEKIEHAEKNTALICKKISI